MLPLPVLTLALRERTGTFSKQSARRLDGLAGSDSDRPALSGRPLSDVPLVSARLVRAHDHRLDPCASHHEEGRAAVRAWFCERLLPQLEIALDRLVGVVRA